MKKLIAIALIITFAFTTVFTGCGTISSTSVSAIEIPTATFYSSPYVEVNKNTPTFDENEITTDSFEEYSNLDSLGRCGAASACIGKDIMPTEERGAIGDIKPTGWHTIKYDNIDGNYLYNRCHLIAFELSGENANEKNLITGTRYMNINGMLPFENKVADYVKSTGNHVMYRVTPDFDGSNLLASGVLIEALSVEDNGNGISFCVYCYNIQPDISIDYATGDSVYSPGSGAAEISTTVNSGGTFDNYNGSHSYLLNKNTMKFHYISCSLGQNTKENNRIYYTGSRDDVIKMGYTPCKSCSP